MTLLLKVHKSLLTLPIKRRSKSDSEVRVQLPFHERRGGRGVPTCLCVACDPHVGGDVYEFTGSSGNFTFREDRRLRAFKNQVLAKPLHLTAMKKMTE